MPDKNLLGTSCHLKAKGGKLSGDQLLGTSCQGPAAGGPVVSGPADEVPYKDVMVAFSISGHFQLQTKAVGDVL